MYKIIQKEILNPTVTSMHIEAPAVANPTVTSMHIEAPAVATKAQPGQFIILRVEEEGERIPLTIADADPQAGTVRIIFQTVGATTWKLAQKKAGEFISDFAGPLGNATYTNGLKKVAVVGGGVGCAIAYPVAKKLHRLGCEVHTVCGFRSKDSVILDEEMQAISVKHILCTDDGSAGQKGVVTDALSFGDDEICLPFNRGLPPENHCIHEPNHD